MPSKILVFVLIVGTANAVIWSNVLEKIPDEFAGKEGCYIKEIDDVIPFNESVNVKGYCYLIHCTKKQLDYVSCGATPNEHEYCLVSEANYDKPYPECCPLVKCFESEIAWLKNDKTALRSKFVDKGIKRYRN